jgi:hypothetical protein
LLGDQRIEGLLLLYELGRERLLLGECVVQGVAAHRSSLRESKPDNEYRECDGECEARPPSS